MKKIITAILALFSAKYANAAYQAALNTSSNWNTSSSTNYGAAIYENSATGSYVDWIDTSSDIDKLLAMIEANNTPTSDPTRSIYSKLLPKITNECDAYNTTDTTGTGDTGGTSDKKLPTCCPAGYYARLSIDTAQILCLPGNAKEKQKQCGNNESLQNYKYLPDDFVGGKPDGTDPFSGNVTILICKCKPGYYKDSSSCKKCPNVEIGNVDAEKGQEYGAGNQSRGIFAISSEFAPTDMTQPITGCYMVATRHQLGEENLLNNTANDFVYGWLKTDNTSDAKPLGTAIVRHYHKDKSATCPIPTIDYNKYNSATIETDKNYCYKIDQSQAVATTCAGGYYRWGTTHTSTNGNSLDWDFCRKIRHNDDLANTYNIYSPEGALERYLCPPYKYFQTIKVDNQTKTEEKEKPGYTYSDQYLQEYAEQREQPDENVLADSIEKCNPYNKENTYTDSRGTYYYDLGTCDLTTEGKAYKQVTS